ncbi:MAG: YfhO family protein, partial [Anaerolineae bacterium]|nr:YfhO family protein [Anaerolineae bacterium]
RYIRLIEEHLPAASLLQAAQVRAIYDTQGERSTLEAPVTRAWFVESACWHADEDTVAEALVSADWQPLRQAHLLGEGDCPALAEDATSTGRVLGIDDQVNRLTLTVETETGGWLVLADTDYPGWLAEVDGVPVEIERANLAFRAVEVPAGAHMVLFAYRPAWLLLGLFISLAALVITLLLLRLRNLMFQKPGQPVE